MDPLLKDRIIRKLELLGDDRGWQVLDYLEFLESRYAERATPDNAFTRFTDTVQNTMRAGKLPVKAISGTVGLLDGAGRIMKGVAAAATAVVDEASKTARDLGEVAKAAGTARAEVTQEHPQPVTGADSSEPT